MYQTIFIDSTASYVSQQAQKTIQTISRNKINQNDKILELTTQYNEAQINNPIFRNKMAYLQEIKHPMRFKSPQQTLINDQSNNLAKMMGFNMKQPDSQRHKGGQREASGPVNRQQDSFMAAQPHKIEAIFKGNEPSMYQEYHHKSVVQPIITGKTAILDINLEEEKLKLQKDAEDANLTQMRLYILRCLNHFVDQLVQLERTNPCSEDLDKKAKSPSPAKTIFNREKSDTRLPKNKPKPEKTKSRESKSKKEVKQDPVQVNISTGRSIHNVSNKLGEMIAASKRDNSKEGSTNNLKVQIPTNLIIPRAQYPFATKRLAGVFETRDTSTTVTNQEGIHLNQGIKPVQAMNLTKYFPVQADGPLGKLTMSSQFKQINGSKEDTSASFGQKQIVYMETTIKTMLRSYIQFLKLKNAKNKASMPSVSTGQISSLYTKRQQKSFVIEDTVLKKEAVINQPDPPLMKDVNIQVDTIMKDETKPIEQAPEVVEPRITRGRGRPPKIQTVKPEIVKVEQTDIDFVEKIGKAVPEKAATVIAKEDKKEIIQSPKMEEEEKKQEVKVTIEPEQAPPAQTSPRQQELRHNQPPIAAQVKVLECLLNPEDQNEVDNAQDLSSIDKIKSYHKNHFKRVTINTSKGRSNSHPCNPDVHQIIKQAIIEDNKEKNDSSVDSDQASENKRARQKIVYIQKMLPIVEFIIDTDSEELVIPSPKNVEITKVEDEQGPHEEEEKKLSKKQDEIVEPKIDVVMQEEDKIQKQQDVIAAKIDVIIEEKNNKQYRKKEKEIQKELDKLQTIFMEKKKEKEEKEKEKEKKDVQIEQKKKIKIEMFKEKIEMVKENQKEKDKKKEIVDVQMKDVEQKVKKEAVKPDLKTEVVKLQDDIIEKEIILPKQVIEKEIILPKKVVEQKPPKKVNTKIEIPMTPVKVEPEPEEKEKTLSKTIKIALSPPTKPKEHKIHKQLKPHKTIISIPGGQMQIMKGSDKRQTTKIVIPSESQETAKSYKKEKFRKESQQTKAASTSIKIVTSTPEQNVKNIKQNMNQSIRTKPSPSTSKTRYHQEPEKYFSPMMNQTGRVKMSFKPKEIKDRVKVEVGAKTSVSPIVEKKQQQNTQSLSKVKTPEKIQVVKPTQKAVTPTKVARRSMRSRPTINDNDFLQLTRRNKPQSLGDKDPYAWNFTGRKQLSKRQLMNINRVRHRLKVKVIAETWKNKFIDLKTEIREKYIKKNMINKKKKEVMRHRIIEKIEAASIDLKKVVSTKDEDSLLLPFKCKFPQCPYRFALSSALGGHISKAHPGQSQAYNHKKNVRDRRKIERQLHKEAMDHYMLNDANPVIIEQIKNNDVTGVNRNTIKRIKRDLVKHDDKFLALQEKFQIKDKNNTSLTLEDIESSLQSEKEQLELMKDEKVVPSISQSTRLRKSAINTRKPSDHSFFSQIYEPTKTIYKKKDKLQLLDQALEEKAPKMRPKKVIINTHVLRNQKGRFCKNQRRGEYIDDSDDDSEMDDQEFEENDFNLEEIMSQQKELMKKLMNSKAAKNDGNDKKTETVDKDIDLSDSKVYNDIKIRCDGQLVGLDKDFTAFGKENIDLEEWLSDLQKKVSTTEKQEPKLEKPAKEKK